MNMEYDCNGSADGYTLGHEIGSAGCLYRSLPPSPAMLCTYESIHLYP